MTPPVAVKPDTGDGAGVTASVPDLLKKSKYDAYGLLVLIGAIIRHQCRR
jgi:hypothetical protein